MDTPLLPFTFKVEKDGNKFLAKCPELLNCRAHGDTTYHALENLKDVVQIYLDTIMEEEIVKQLTKIQ